MLFNSFEFLIFLPIVFILYWFVFNKSLKWQNLLVLIASYFFYGWWSWKFMLLLALSTLLDFLYGFGVSSPNSKKSKFFLWLSIINNLGILAVFKYYNFFATEFQKGLEIFGIHTNLIFLNLALPVGISFYTFHGMSYVFDIYRGNQKPINNFIEYAVFVAFFPLLVAGPIERAHHLLPQIQKSRFFTRKKFLYGLNLILWGLFKKIVVADSIAIPVNFVFDNFHSLSTFNLCSAAIGFSIQIYCDFSGYSDIAIGTAKLFGIELLSNFKFPYFSRDIAEFWRRWHISLSTWFRDYLYIPLGGSKNGKKKAIRNTFIIFLVSGFWHGASWNFIFWGLIHAFAFLPLLVARKNRNNLNNVVAENSKYPTFKELLNVIKTFGIVTIAWIFFRSKDLKSSFNFLIDLFSMKNKDYSNSPQFWNYEILFFIFLLFIGDWSFRKNERILNIRFFNVFTYAILFWLVLIKAFGSNQIQFIYFQF